MKKKFSLLAVVLFIVLSSCHKGNRIHRPIPNQFIDLKVDAAFKFDNFKDLKTSIKIPTSRSSGIHIIQIYDAHPNDGGKLILTGSVNQEGVFDLPVRIAARLKEVYVGNLSSTGTNEYVAVPVEGSTIHYHFSGVKSIATGNSCADDCTNTAQGSYNNLIIASGEVYCIDEGTTASFTHLKIESGGKLRVCGNALIHSYKQGGGNGTIIVSSTGVANLPKYSNHFTIENYGQLNFTGNGTIQLHGSIHNWAEISSSIVMVNKGSIINDGTFNISQRFTNDPNATFVNNCTFRVNKNGNNAFKQNSDFTNNGYVYVKGTANFSASGNKMTTLGLGSLIDTKHFKIEGNITGPSAQGAQITATNNGQTSASANITGTVDLCSAGGISPDHATYGPDVTFCSYTLTQPSCAANTAPEITSSLQIGGIENQAMTPYVMTATGTEPITYAMDSLPTGLSFDGTTHTLSGTPTTAGSYNVMMTASNFMGSDIKTLVVIVTQPPSPPVITSPLTDNTTVNQGYTYTFTASGNGPITYNVSNLPAGLVFSSTTHEITGTPTSSGTFNIVLAATNSAGTTNEMLVLTVGEPPAITSSLTASGTAGVQFNTYTATASGTPDITFSVNNLPDGLTFDPSNQTINGTPTYSGVTNVTLTAINSYGTDVETLIITISEGVQPPTITSAQSATATKDYPFSYTITADGSQPIVFNASNLPTALTFNGNVISGIPADTGIFNIPLTASNSAGSDNDTLMLTVGTGSGTDSDGDGIPDNLDAYPTDPTRAFNSYYPNEDDYSSLAFEDLWPAYGDYDFNDFVVNINYTLVTNAQNEVVDVIAKYQIMADGASLNNGFGIVFQVPSSAVASVSGYIHLGNAVILDPKGFEVGHVNQTVIIPFDAINPIMDGGMANTIPNGKYVQTTVNTVTTHFSTPQASIGTPPFNPFIFVDQERGHEVHLKDQPPTELVDPTYFGTESDASDSATGRYYQSSTGLPWGIEIPVSFDYPIEKADILTAHLKFAAWALSSGSDYPDWYLNNAGYRNSTLIYVIPSN